MAASNANETNESFNEFIVRVLAALVTTSANLRWHACMRATIVRPNLNIYAKGNGIRLKC